MRPARIERNVVKNADGSCIVSMGDTKVLCCATLEEGVPGWRRNQHAGWVTAEYAMLPASGGGRTQREYRGRKGRSQEIERLVGRSLRACVDLAKLDGFTLTVDCDVLNADGGTRCASVTGGWVAMYDAIARAVEKKKLATNPIIEQVAAVSVGVVEGVSLCDLDYGEDSHADVDCNVVATGAGGLVELQATGERATFTRDEVDAFLGLALPAIDTLCGLQLQVTNFKRRVEP
jgi:ribonuclease PH